MKKLFIKLCKLFGYQIIDQNSFFSPTLNKELNENLSTINKESIILPLGQVNITKKIKLLLLIFKTNTEIEVLDQNKKRLFEKPKIEYSLRSLNSLIKSINFCKLKYPQINIKTIIVDDNSKSENLDKIKNLTKNKNIEIINLDRNKYKDLIQPQRNNDTFGNLSSLLKCYEIAKKDGEDLIFFVEDDYLHFEPMLEEMISSYERIASQLNKDIFMCPSDYPYLYMSNEKTNVLIGNKRHWRTVSKTLCTFLTSKNLLNKYWDNFKKHVKTGMSPSKNILTKFTIKNFVFLP